MDLLDLVSIILQKEDALALGRFTLNAFDGEDKAEDLSKRNPGN